MHNYDKRNNMPGQIQRPRINALLRQGIQHPLVMVVAGTGYGKTCAVTQFTEQADARVIWIRASNINNYTEHFWRTLRDSIGGAIPLLAPKLDSIDFPRTYPEQDAFLRIFADAIYSGKQVLMVIDDYQHIHNDEIKQFLHSVLEVSLENFCMIAISNAKQHQYMHIDQLQGEPFRIIAEDLRYSDDEIRQRLELSGIPASNAVVAAAQKATDGWPLAVHVLATHWNDQWNYFMQAPFSIDEFLHMFYSGYYASYPPEIQMMLVKLAHLPMFTLKIVNEIGGCDLNEFVTMLQRNPFIVNDHANVTYTFQVVYMSFLLTCFVVDDEELQRIRLIAAQHYRENGYDRESIRAYTMAGRYDDAFAIIRSYPIQKITYDLAEFFLQSMSGFDAAYVEEHPLVTVYTALLKKIYGQRSEAETILRSLLDAYTDDREVSGEIYLSLAEILISRDFDEAVEYFAKAAELLPNGSKLRVPDALYIINRSLIKLPDAKPGSLDAYLQSIQNVLGYLKTLYQRASDSWGMLLFAEAAYYQLNMDRASEMAHKAVHHAALNNQYDVQCNAWFLLLRIEMMHGNLAGASNYMDQIDALIQKKELSSLYVLRDCISGWFHLKMNDFASIPKWITETTAGEITGLLPSSERDIILKVLYHVAIGHYMQALAMIDAFIPFCEARQFWTVKLYLYIAKAIVLAKTEKPEEALQALQIAYTLTYDNNILVPFIEMGHHMRSLISMVRKIEDNGLDSAWLSTIYAKASSYAKRINAMTREYNKRKANTTPGASKLDLSSRETEVLGHLAKGLKYEEISDFMGISINGVKKHITSIYSKMGAINRADAIYIAMSEGIIK